MRPVTINLPESVYQFLELRAAWDDLRVPQAIEQLLTELAEAKINKRPVLYAGSETRGRPATTRMAE